ncbi:MAG: AbrB/MazE/SpoVT family DNA-binding domain-containing protein [Oscillospiraceae bacterium]|jgi:transcriptional pleiotropic regulator of transition state genes|nr:AbrB/MazE/SpoVT family DNA-binding domain-containing protein [Oscillospiraceae bacterium]
MKALYIIRKVDELGRIVLPMGLRREFNISEHDAIEFFVEDDKIIMKKYEPACIFCHSAVDISIFEGRNICKKCAQKITTLTKEVNAPATKNDLGDQS